MPWGYRLRDWLARHLPRRLAINLGIRRVTPFDGYWPRASVHVPPPDTGGGYRAAHRQQDPAVDPREPGGGESGSAGTDHGWSNCTMASGADAMAYQLAPDRGDKTPWGGDLRHRQGDQSGGTDLYDLREAWADYGETLTIKSGAGWSTLVDGHNAGRAIVVQGEGNVPGSETFDGGHACVIGPETQSDGDWLWGDPLASDWQWVAPSKIRTWMEAWAGSGLAYAWGDKPPPPPPDPAPAPKPPPPPPGPGYPEGYRAGLRDGTEAEAGRTFASWNPGGPFHAPDLAGALWDRDLWGGYTLAGGGAWSAWPIPLAAVWTAQNPATWGVAAWTAAVWRG